jgi:hypothetical protein
MHVGHHSVGCWLELSDNTRGMNENLISIHIVEQYISRALLLCMWIVTQ